MPVRNPRILTTYTVTCLEWFLERGMSLPVAQIFVIVLEEIFQRTVGNLTILLFYLHTDIAASLEQERTPRAKARVTIFDSLLRCDTADCFILRGYRKGAPGP